MKKLLAMLLALVMVLAFAAGCSNDAGTSDAGTSDAGTSDAGTSDAGTGDAAAAEFSSGMRRITIFQNNIADLTATEVVWAEGKDTMYNGYSLAEYVEKNFKIQPADDAYGMLVAGTDFYGAAGDWATYKELYVAIEDTAGKGRTPITCGPANNSGSNPFNIELIFIGDEAIIFTDVAGSKVGKISAWIDYLKEAEFPFADAETYEFELTDGTTKTVAKADIDSIALADIVSIVPTGFVA